MAKFLELLAQASLGSAVFVYLRALYTGPESVPFGALFAGLQITRVSYLWSLEFAGVVTSRNFKRARKFVFLVLIPLTVAIAVAIGPSIAIALTPTLGNIYDGWAIACLNATEEQLFPSNIDPTVLVYSFSDSCSTGDCARYGWETAMNIAQSSQQSQKIGSQQGNLALTQDALPNREIRWNASMTEHQNPYWVSLSATVTIPSKVIAGSLAKLAQQSYYAFSSGSAADHNFTITSRQPTVTVNCTAASWLDLTSIRTSAGNGVPQYVLRSELLRSFNESLSSNETQSFHWVFIGREDSISQPPPQSNPSVWALIRYPLLTASPLGMLGCCAIYAGYAHVQNTVSYNNIIEYQGDGLVRSQTNSLYASDVNIPAVWLNKTLPDSSVLLNYGLLGVDTPTFLASSLAISMAQLPKQTPTFFSDDDGSLYPNPSLTWRGSSAEHHDFYWCLESWNAQDAQGKYRLRMDVSSHGYGYQIDQTSKVIAISVLAAYCLYILTFVVLMLVFNRVYSNAWDSIGELTALAIMSRPDDKLRNTSAGIETVDLFKLPMNIRANDNNHLEIVFKDDEGGQQAGVVEKDKEYE
ncbi:hypothetical protein KCU67_g1843, partial [Aureobasidium melanogenum]